MSAQPLRIDDDPEPEPSVLSPTEGRRLLPVLDDATAGIDAPDAATEAERDPGDVARGLALCIAEIMAGARDLDTIARWISDDVHRHLAHRVTISARARSVTRRPVARPFLRVGSVLVDRPRPDVAETAVVLHSRARARAVAIRLELRDQRWRATTVAVL